MNKKVIIGIAIFICLIFIAIALGIFVLFSTLNKEKISITPEQFETAMESKNYTIADATNQYSQYPYIRKVSIAYTSDYQIEFYELQDEDYAMSFYNNNKSIFEQSNGNVTSSSNVSMNNYAKYTLDTNGKYKVVSKINNTVIYINANNEYKDEIKTILEELGY